MPNNDRSNYHAYRKEVNAHRGLKRFLLVVLVLLLIAIAGLTCSDGSSGIRPHTDPDTCLHAGTRRRTHACTCQR